MRAPDLDPRTFSDATYLGFDHGVGKHRMGLRPVPDGAWLEPDRNRGWQLGQKRAALAADPSPWLLEPQDGATQQGVDRLAALLTAELGDPIAPTIEACGTATQEDWCVMAMEDTWRLRAACLCFPSRWVLAEKVGHPISTIHEPVPRYEAELGGLVESFFDRLRDDRIVWRLNWNIWDDGRLAQPFREADAPVYDLPDPAEVGDRVVLRNERQTLRRLTEDTIAFSIRVHQRPLCALVDQPGAIDQLRTILADPTLAGHVPKKIGRLTGPLTAWLAGLP